jgi:hypothetical protein
MMRQRLFLTILAFALIAKSQVMAQDRSCSAFISSPAASISFLEEQIDIRESPCITTVITQLGRTRTTEAVAVLIRYLDFVDPATAPRADGFADKRPDYPAIGALLLIGKAATVNLLSAIQTSESSIIRRNAAKTYQAIYRDNLALGIHILRTGELVANSTVDENRLREVREMLADDCAHRSEEEALICKKAVDSK